MEAESAGGLVAQAPKANATEDAPWSNLYEANKGTIGGDPNKISPGMELSMPGGGSHTVQSGETLSGIASSGGGGLGSQSLAAERGGVSPTGGDYSSGGQYSGSTGGATSSTETPTPPVKPSEYGGSGGNSETGSGGMGKISSLSEERGGMSPTGGDYSSGGQTSGETGGATSVPSSLGSSAPTPPSRPASLGSAGQSGTGMSSLAEEGGGTSSSGTGGAGSGEGTALAGAVRSLVGDAKKPPRGKS